MKKTLFLFLFFVSANLFATDYYVSNSGSDSNSGTDPSTPWATLSKVNSAMDAGTFQSGDQILFKRGDEWRGSLTISISGLTIGAYDSGDKPLITGLKEISGWTDLGNNIWRSSDSDLPEDYTNLSVIFINGLPYNLGRYPNDSYRYYDLYSDSVQNVLIDNNASYSDNQFQGAQCAFRNNLYIINKITISSHNSTTLTLSENSTYPLNSQDNGDEKNNAYIIQNDIDCLDLTGEWAYRDGYLYVYFEGNLNNQTVEMPSDSVGIYATDNTSIEDVEIKGYIYSIIGVGDANNLIIDNITASYAQYFFTESGTGSLSLTNSTIKTIFSDAVKSSYYSTYIYNNTFENIGDNFSLAVNSFSRRCLSVEHAPTTVRRNAFKNIGYNVINWNQNVATIDSNYIDNFGTILADGGAIYVYKTNNQGSVVRHNIVVNGHTSFDGIAYHPSVGLYQDANCSGITWEYNTCVNVDFAFKVNRSYGTSIMRYNKAFDIGKIHTVDGTGYPDSYGVSLSYSTTTTPPIEPQFQGLTFTNNVMVGNELGQNMMWNSTTDFNSNNVVDSNTYATPFQYRWGNGERLFKYKGSTYWSLSEWQNGGAPISSWDDNSTASPIYYTDGTLSDKAVIIVNPTASDSLYTLNPDWKWIDINGDTVYGAQEILPYDGKIFFKIGIDTSNSSPIISSELTGQTIDVGGVFSDIVLDNYVSDSDTPDSLIAWTYDGDSILTVDITDRVVTVTYPGGWTGSEEIIFTASDGVNSNNKAVVFQVNDTVTLPIGDFLILDVSNVDSVVGAQIEAGEYIHTWHPGYYALWKGIDLSNVDSIEYVYDTPYDDRAWEIRLDSANGATIYSGTHNSSGGWEIKDTVKIDVDFDYGVRDFYLYATTYNTWTLHYFKLIYEGTSVSSPIISDIPNQVVEEGGSFAPVSLDGYVEDSDTPDSLITWTYEGDSVLTVEIEDRIVTVTYPSDWTGSEEIIFMASDGTSSDSVTVLFQVNDTVPNPIGDFLILDVSNVDTVVGAQIEAGEYIHTWHPGYYALWEDVDLSNVDSIEYVYDTPYDDRAWEIRLDSANGTTIYSGTHNSSGGWYIKDTVKIDVDFEYGVRDFYLYATTYNTWTLHYFKLIYEGTTVASPIVSGIPNQVIEAGESFAPFSLDGYVEDSDTPDSLITWAYDGDSILTVDITDRVVTVTYPSDWTGSEEIIFTASDGTSSGSDTVAFQVLEDTIEYSSYKIDETNEDDYSGVYPNEPTSITGWATGDWCAWYDVDLDNVDSIVWSYGVPYDDRTWEMRLDSADGQVIYQGTNLNTGSWDVYDSLRVGVDFDYGVRDVYLYATSVNTWNLDYLRFIYEGTVTLPPSVSDIPDQSIISGVSFSNIDLDAYVYDSDTPDSLITWTYSGSDSLSVTIVDRVASITYPSEWIGSESIIFIASDGTSSDSNTVTFQVLEDTTEYSSYKIDETNENNYSGVYPNEPIAITGWTTGDWSAWYDVDLDNVDSIVWSYGVPYDDRTWEMRLDSYDGQVIYQGTNINTGNWTNYDSLRVDVDFDYGVRDVYLYSTSVNTWNFDYLRFVYSAPVNYSLKISDFSTSYENLGLDNEFFTIYPVPAKDQLTIKINNERLGIGYKAIIYDMTGKAVKAFELYDIENVISIEELNSGIYILKINADRSYSKTFIIE